MDFGHDNRKTIQKEKEDLFMEQKHLKMWWTYIQAPKHNFLLLNGHFLWKNDHIYTQQPKWVGDKAEIDQ